MRVRNLLLTLALSVVGTARPVKGVVVSYPNVFNATSVQEDPANNNSGNTNIPTYPLLNVWAEPQLVGTVWGLAEPATAAATCFTWGDVDKYGGISSLWSWRHRKGRDYWCLMYKPKDCQIDPNNLPSVYYWKNAIKKATLPKEWDNVFHSTRCHHGPDPWHIPSSASGGMPELLDPALFQEITSEDI